MQDILESYNEPTVTKSRFYFIIILITVLYLSFFILDMFLYIESLTWKGFRYDWISLTLGVLVPATGLGFFIANTQGGWFILATYFTFIAVLAICALGKGILDRGFSSLFTLGLRQLFISITTISLSALLQTPGIRHSVRIKTITWIVMLIVAAFFACCIIFLG